MFNPHLNSIFYKANQHTLRCVPVNVKVLFQTKFFWPCQDLKNFRGNQVKKKLILGKVRGQLLHFKKVSSKKGDLFRCTLLFITGAVALTVFCLMYTYLSLITFQHETTWEPAKLGHQKPVNKKEIFCAMETLQKSNTRHFIEQSFNFLST